MNFESREKPENLKDVTWQRLRMEVERIVDKLGKPVDVGIKECVTALHALGLTTSSSCEGHADCGTLAPYVDVGFVPREISERIMVFRNAGKPFDAETLQLINETRKRLDFEREQVKELLAEFYINRQVPSDQRLIIEELPNQTCITNQGAESQDDQSPTLQKERLLRYQKEVAAFTQFVKRKFFDDSN